MENIVIEEDVRFCKTGDVIVKEGDPSDLIFLIKKGYAKIVKNHSSDKEKVIALVGPGEIIGELGIILDLNRQATVIAKTEIELEVIHPEIFGKIYETPLGKKLQPIIQSMAERIRINGIRLAEQGLDYQDESMGEAKSIELIAGSEVALKFLQGKESIVIDKFPFKVGRYSGKLSDSFFHKNDLYLVEQEPYVLSPSHFSITHENDQYYFNDRSNIGGIVNGKKVGGLADDSIRKVELKDGENLLFLGKEHYNILFKIVI